MPLLKAYENVIQLEMSFDYELDEKRIERAVYLITEKIPMLGCRFVVRQG